MGARGCPGSAARQRAGLWCGTHLSLLSLSFLLGQLGREILNLQDHRRLLGGGTTAGLGGA